MRVRISIYEAYTQDRRLKKTSVNCVSQLPYGYSICILKLTNLIKKTGDVTQCKKIQVV